MPRCQCRVRSRWGNAAGPRRSGPPWHPNGLTLRLLLPWPYGRIRTRILSPPEHRQSAALPHEDLRPDEQDTEANEHGADRARDEDLQISVRNQHSTPEVLLHAGSENEP